MLTRRHKCVSVRHSIHGLIQLPARALLTSSDAGAIAVRCGRRGSAPAGARRE